MFRTQKGKNIFGYKVWPRKNHGWSISNFKIKRPYFVVRISNIKRKRDILIKTFLSVRPIIVVEIEREILLVNLLNKSLIC